MNGTYHNFPFKWDQAEMRGAPTVNSVNTQRVTSVSWDSQSAATQSCEQTPFPLQIQRFRPVLRLLLPFFWIGYCHHGAPH